MHRIDGEGATAQNLFTEGDPTLGIVATVVTADWLTALQEEVAGFIESKGLTLDKADNTQLEQALAALETGGGFRNPLINGEFRLFQRHGAAGALVLASDPETYVADRWLFDYEAGGNGAQQTLVRQRDFVKGQTDVPGDPENYLELEDQVGAIPNSRQFLEQRIEGADTFHGKEVTLQGWVNIDSTDILVASTFQVDVEIDQAFNGSGTIQKTGSQVVNAGEWTRILVTVTLDSATGKTFGADHHLAVRIIIPTTSDGGVNLFANFGLYEGGTAPPHQARPVELELELARRYYEKSFPYANGVGISTLGQAAAIHDTGASSDVLGLAQRFKVEKRSTPTMVWYSPAVSTADRVRYNGVDEVVTSQDQNRQTTGFPRLTTPPAGGLEEVFAQWTAESEI